jgi:serine/threonine protein phosphatase PrpC
LSQVALSDPTQAGIACALTMVLVAGDRAAVAHVGNCSCYFVRDGGAVQLTTEHTHTNALVRRGKLARRTENEAAALSRALGTRATVQVDVTVLDVFVGDRFVLCTHSVAERVPSVAWLARLASEDDVETLPVRVVQHMRRKNRGDDATVVAVEVVVDDDDRPTLDELTVQVSSRPSVLETVFMFDGMSLATLDRVVSASTVERHEAGAIILRAGDTLRSLIVVIDGELTLRGPKQPASLLGSGGSFGASAMVRPRPARATLYARTPCTLLRFDRDALWRVVRARPWLAVELLERLARHLSAELEDLQQAKAPHREPTPKKGRPRKR